MTQPSGGSPLHASDPKTCEAKKEKASHDIPAQQELLDAPAM
jgi:hypothetical protein